MFNFFNIAKDQNELGMEQENTTLSDKRKQVENEGDKQPVHGEDGVCCGGCGG